MTPHGPQRIRRREFLGMLTAAGIAACTSPIERVVAPASDRPTPTASPSAVASPSTRPASPAPHATRFTADARDAYPDAKQVAGRFVEALTAYTPRTQRRRVLRNAARHAVDAFDGEAVLGRASDLFVPDAQSVGRVVYPQLGGLTLGPGADRICVMVVVRQQLLRKRRGRERVTTEITRTVDVRLVKREGRWRVEDLADAGGAQVKSGRRVSQVARRVLDDPRIELPDSARWDILRGDIDERLLATMGELADVASYSVAVLKSGHPRNVFGTDLVSGHTMGRGVDIWKVAGQPVVLQRQGTKSPARRFTEAALRDLRVPELGSPWDLDGPPQPGKVRPSFTDAVHADHIHIAYKAA